ncbi:acetyltransferase [Aeromicrobium halocynthiae]|uniref:Acetyltransferase n=1 Tax=Aeromicrobium halocynthiae TaxID=560557 RepID=A0ABP5HQE8_9ACTN
MTTDLVLVGCGGFGREVVTIVDAINASGASWNLVGFVDDRPSRENLERAQAIDLPVLGGIEHLSSLLEDGEGKFAVAVGDPAVRRSLADRINRDDRAATLVDPRAVIGRDVRLGAGVVVGASAQITTNVEIGRYVHIDRAAQVGHDSLLGDFTTVHPSAVVSGDCEVGTGVRIGTSATILPGRRISDHALIGASACVTRDVPEGATVRGVPAR